MMSSERAAFIASLIAKNGQIRKLGSKGGRASAKARTAKKNKKNGGSR